MTTNTQGHMAIVEAFDQQIGFCAGPSPFTTGVLKHLRADFIAGGTTAQLIGAWLSDPIADALPLRFAAALHALALSRAEPALAQIYPPHGTGDLQALERALPDILNRQRPAIERVLASPPQTNEVGRSAVLLGGFLVIAEKTALPLRLLEIGASAGLNMIWDRYAYEIDGEPWGDPSSAVRLRPQWKGSRPPLHIGPVLMSRSACDRAPIALKEPHERQRLLSYIWPDQSERMNRTEGAIAMTADAGLTVDGENAAPWLTRHLNALPPGVATVVYHSIMWQYLGQAEQDRITGLMDAVGRRTDRSAPLAWLRFESVSSGSAMELRLRVWPGGRDTCLAEAQAHGAAITWFGPDAGASDLALP